MFEKIKLYIKIGIRVVWLFFAVFMWIFGLQSFLDDKTFTSWMIWGGIDTLFILPTAFQFIWGEAQRGYRDGKRIYSIDITENAFGYIRANIADNRWSQALLTLAVSIVLFILAGPIFLFFKMVITLFDFIPLIGELRDLY